MEVAIALGAAHRSKGWIAFQDQEQFLLLQARNRFAAMQEM
jgi:hypothetical protein